jgi:signal transduction histidine kinase
MLYYPLSAFLSGSISFLFCLYVFITNPKAQINRVFSAFLLCVSWMSFSYFFWMIAHNTESALFWVRSTIGANIFVPATLFHFGIHFINEQKKHFRTSLFIYILCSIFFLLNFASLTVKGMEPRLFFPYWPIIGPAFVPFIVTFFGVVVYTLFLAKHKMRRLFGDDAKRLKYMIIAVAIGAAGGFTNYLLCLRIPIPPIGNGLIFVGMIFAPHAFLKYRLMAAGQFTKNLAIAFFFTILAFGLSATFGSAMYLYLSTEIGERWWMVLVVVTILVTALAYASTLYTIRRTDEEETERVKKARKALELSGESMIEIDDVKRLAKIIPRYLTMFYHTKLGISIEHASIFLLNGEKSRYELAAESGKKQFKGLKIIDLDSRLSDWFTKMVPLMLEHNIVQKKDVQVLKTDDLSFWMRDGRLSALDADTGLFLTELKEEMQSLGVTVCVPGFFKHNLLGFLLLGPKSQGDFTRIELDLFSELSSDAMVAFKSAQLSEMMRRFKEEKAEAEKLIAMGELMICVRHELGNILNNITTVLQSMEDAFRQSRLDQIEQFSEIAENSVNRIKMFWSAIDDYKNKSQSQERRSYNLRQTLDQALLDVADHLNEWNISVYSTIDPRINILGSKTWPDIFKHLLVNSCYSMENIGGSISYNATVDRESHLLELTQADTGRDLSTLLEKSARLYVNSFPERGKVGGLNLFLAKKIITDHHGTFEIASNDRKGTKFVVKLPLANM